MRIKESLWEIYKKMFISFINNLWDREFFISYGCKVFIVWYKWMLFDEYKVNVFCVFFD